MTEPVSESRRTLVRRAMLRLKLGKNWRWIKLSHQIQGWLTDAEAAELFHLAKYLTPANAPVVVELGSWQGKSSVVLAGGLFGKRDANLYCIDPSVAMRVPSTRRNTTTHSWLKSHKMSSKSLQRTCGNLESTKL
jgi:hypothetical protein